MNNTGNEIRIAYEMVMTTVVKGTQYILLNTLLKCLDENGYNVEEFSVKSEPPISSLIDIDVKAVLTTDEQREILGYDPLELEEEVTEDESDVEEQEDNIEETEETENNE